MKRQNRWARKWGLRMLTVTLNLVLASVLITITYLVAINLYEAGAFTVPGSQP